MIRSAKMTSAHLTTVKRTPSGAVANIFRDRRIGLIYINPTVRVSPLDLARFSRLHASSLWL